MAKVIELKGQRFGKWTVLSRAGSSKCGIALWLCKCGLCGRKLVVNGKNLRGGHSLKCRECYESEVAKKLLLFENKMTHKITTPMPAAWFNFILQESFKKNIPMTQIMRDCLLRSYSHLQS